MRLLLVAPNWIGDAVMAQPAMRAIARHRPEAELLVHGRPWMRDLLPWLNLPGARFAPRLEAADECWLFPNSFGSAWRAWRAGIRRRIGYRGDGRRLLLTDAARRKLDMRHEHHRLFFLDLPRQFGIPVDDEAVRLRAPDDALERGRRLLASHGLDPARTLNLAPGAQFGGAKRYPPERYAEVVSALSREGWHWVALGLADDREAAAAALADARGPCWNAAGETTLAEALALIAAGRLMLCNDSGFMHVAAGLGQPTVAPFGATDPARTAPSGPSVRILYRPAACSPCLQRECTTPGQPCMANIAPAELCDACREMLEAAA
ncbi:MAG: lipopolysaccharide heptosyltransferase II [Mariprofundaceae bacterium]